MFHIKKNDIVKVLSGDDKNKTGKVIKVYPEEGTALIQGLNFAWKHLKRSVNYPHGARIQKEAPVKISNLMAVCQSCNKPTRIQKKIMPDGRKVRICKKCRQPVSLEE